MKISQRALNIAPSPTIAMSSRAKAMREAGQDVISFDVGEPDFPTPENICRAACAAIAAGHTKYTPAAGLPKLKQAVVQAAARDLGLEYDPAMVVVSNGGKHALMNIWETIVDPGDEVIVFAPYWVSYPPQIELCGGRAVIIPTRGDGRLPAGPGAGPRALNERTIAILMNSPSNPAGAIFTEATMRALAEIAVERDLLIVSDEIYKHILFDGRKHLSPAQLGEEVKARTILADGVAKTYSMTGWRIGWMIAPKEIAKRRGTSRARRPPIRIRRRSTPLWRRCWGRRIRWRLCGRSLSGGGITCPRPQRDPGRQVPQPRRAFYVFPDISAHVGARWGGRRSRRTWR